MSWYTFDALGWLVDPICPACSRRLPRRNAVVFLRASRERTAYAMPSAPLHSAGLGGAAGRRPSEAQAWRRDARPYAAVRRRTGLYLDDPRAFPEELTISKKPVHAASVRSFLRAGHHRQIHGRRCDGLLERAARRYEHATHACSAALRIMQEIPGLNENWRKEAEAGPSLPSGEDRHRAQHRLCCVGNLGSEARFDYR